MARVTPQATLLLGPSRAGKTGRLLKRYAELVASGGRGLWLAPTSAAAVEVQDALAGAATAACLTPGVATFAGFARQLLTDARVAARALSPAESRRLLEQAIAEVRRSGRLRHFARAAETAGFVAQAAAFIADAKRRDAWAEQLQKTAAGQRERELAAIYGEYQRLLVAAAAFDAEGLFWAARDAVKQDKSLLTGTELVVVDGFHDFTAAQYDILQQLAKSAGAMVVALTVDRETAAGEAGARPDLFARSLETMRGLRQRMSCQVEWCGAEDRREPREGEAPAEPEEANRTGSAGASPSRDVFAKILAGLFSDRAAGDEPGNFRDVRDAGSVPMEVIAAPSQQREFEEVARRAKRLLHAGVPAAEIVVALRRTADHATRLRQTFADFGLPAWIDARPPLAATPLVRSLFNLLRLHADDWPYRRLLAAATDRSLAWGDAAQFDATGRAALERTIRAAQIASGAEPLLAHVAALATRHAELEEARSSGAADAPARNEPILQAAALALPQLQWLRELLHELPTKATLAGWVDAVTELADAAGFLLVAETDGAGACPAPRPAWQALVGALSAAERADRWAGHSGDKLSLHELIALAANVAAQTSAPGGGDPTGRVRIVGAEHARHLSPQHLFVAGLSEQSFPAAVRDDRRREEDRLEQWLGAELDEPTPAGVADAPRAAGEMLLFYQLLARPGQSLTLSYPALDAKAQSLPPSPYLAELERNLPRDYRRIEIPLAATAGERAARDHPPASLSELRRAAVADALDDAPELLAAVVAAPATADTGRSLANGVECVAARGVRDEFGPYEGLLVGATAQADFARRFGGDHLWSPSQLESYALCPFKFFAEGPLRLEPAPDLVLQSDFGRRGVMLHETLAALHRKRAAAADPHEPVAETAEELAALRDALVDEYRQSLIDVSARAPRTGLDAALWEIERRQIDSWAEQLADQELAYRGCFTDWESPPRPRYFEARFGPGSRQSESAADADLTTDEPYRLQLPEETLRLTGQIDRIDVGRKDGRTAFNVIDYKTSARAAVKPEQLADGRQLQLPLYAMAAQELLLAAQDAVAWSAGYWSVQGNGLGKPGRKGGPLQIASDGGDGSSQDSAWAATRAQLVERVAEIVAGIRRAEFPVFSADEHCTSYCSLRTVCRIAHVRSLQKTWHGVSAPEESDDDPP
ncbi:MAG: hypothetical protein CMJ58_13725 [Planctomycetaceae bacterium]|nr:hypothetical protein [Planctomycetaceae bacterium]